ncbi:MAG: DUF4139 domain-containing protein, partial [Alphaproteobacteria bacterium]
LRRAVLSTAGLAYLEHRADVDGEGDLALTVRLDQVDDVLKSAVVYDDRGGVGIVRLPGREPLEEAFRSLPFAADALTSPVALLNALQGASVAIAGARTVEGRLLHVVAEQARLPEGGLVTRHRVSVATAQGIQQAVLEDLESVRFSEPRLQAQIEGALAAIAAHREKDTRTLSIHLSGAGRRTVTVGYVVEAPIWKATYRLSVPGGEATSGRLQGWAVLENLTGGDWKDIDLTLVAGQPVAFRQAIYTAFFQPRPEIPVETVGRVLPRPDEGTLGKVEAEEARAEARPSPRAAMSSPAPMMAMPYGGAPAPAPPPPPARPAQSTAAAAGEDAVAQVLFRYAHPVSVASGQSAMVPIVDRAVPVRAVALYQPTTEANHPLAAVSLTNDSGATLPPGVLTLYEQGRDGASHVGDARLATLPAGEERMLAFAVDRGIAVAREQQRQETISTARIAQGVMTVTVVDRQTTIYRIKAAKPESRSVVIEQARPADWRLAQPEGRDIELARGAWRIPVRLSADGTATLPVSIERPRRITVRLDGIGAGDVAAYINAPQLDPRLRQALVRLVELRGALDASQRRLRAIEEERKSAGAEQERIRANLAAVPGKDPLHTRYLNALRTQEDRLDRLAGELSAAQAAESAARTELSSYVAGLDL